MSLAKAGFVFKRAGLSDAEVVRQISEAAYVPAYEAMIRDLPKPAAPQPTRRNPPRLQRGGEFIHKGGGLNA